MKASIFMMKKNNKIVIAKRNRQFIGRHSFVGSFHHAARGSRENNYESCFCVRFGCPGFVFKIIKKTNVLALEQQHEFNSKGRFEGNIWWGRDRYTGQGFAKSEYFMLLVCVKELLMPFFRPLSFGVEALKGLPRVALRYFIPFYFIYLFGLFFFIAFTYFCSKI